MNTTYKLNPVPWKLSGDRITRHFNNGDLICNVGVYDLFTGMDEGKFVGNLFIGTNWNPYKEAIIAIFMAVTFVYMFALQSRYENTVRGTIANALRLAIGNLPKTAGMIIIWLIWVLILVYLHKAAPAFFMLYGLSLPGYLCAMLYNGVFNKLETEGE